MAKYKIVHLITSLKIGGAETILYDLVRKMDSDLFENYVIYFYEGPNSIKLKDIGIKTYQIKGLICKYDPIFFFRLLSLIKKINPDCIHSSLWSANVFGTLISYLLNIPITCALHLATNFESTAKNSHFRNMIDKVSLTVPRKIVVVSDMMVEDLKANNPTWFPFNKLEIIKNGIDLNYVTNQALLKDFKRENLNISKNCFVIGTVGRFVPRKNHVLLVESFALLKQNFKDVKLILVGYGPLENLIKKRVKELDIVDDVIFIRTEQAYGFYPLFDCFVLSSNGESFGLVTLEAMSFKLPCIVTNALKGHEIITDGRNGYIAKPNDPIDLYNKIKGLYESKDESKRIGRNGYETVLKNFNLEKMVNKYSDLFIELCKNK